MTRQKIGLSGWVTLSICMYNSQQTSSQNGTRSTLLERKWRQSTNYQSDKYWKTASSLFKMTPDLFISKKTARESECISGVTKTIVPLRLNSLTSSSCMLEEGFQQCPSTVLSTSGICNITTLCQNVSVRMSAVQQCHLWQSVTAACFFNVMVTFQLEMFYSHLSRKNLTVILLNYHRT